MYKKSTYQFQYGKNLIKLETGNIARQADSSVIVNMNNTIVLVTVVISKEENQEKNFFPLTVNYQEKTYAVGKFPGGFFKREGRPNESEILTARLIDRSIRPLFPKNFLYEIQIIATTISMHPEIYPDIVAVIGVSAALSLLNIPCLKTIGIANVGFIQNKYCLNPKISDCKNSLLNLKISGTSKEILMIESNSKFLTEKQILCAITYGYQKQQNLIHNIKKFIKNNKNKNTIVINSQINKKIKNKIIKFSKKKIKKIYKIQNKKKRNFQYNKIEKKIYNKLFHLKNFNENEFYNIFHIITKKIVRKNILKKKIRIDNRKNNEIRKINIKIGILPRTHGSALFTRGETQALIIVTLGTEKDAQNIDSITQEGLDRFLLHYNFLPYCVGEISKFGSPKRREIGHGNLAKQSILPILPCIKKFPYTIRVVSEITESNGSSSMATVCGTSLALMDAGIPIKCGIARIAMGLIKEKNKFVILSDITSDEDKFGDIDFKVSGSKTGITSLQMDVKTTGITKNIIKKILKQAKKSRINILEKMHKIINIPKSKISKFAPRIYTIQIKPNQIKDVIGKNGITIRKITEQTKTSIEVQNTGIIKIASKNTKLAKLAIKKINDITSEIIIGKIYKGKVTNIMNFGVLIKILNKKEGLVHISQISHKYVKNIDKILHIGQKTFVKVMNIDKYGRLTLSIKNAITK